MADELTAIEMMTMAAFEAVATTRDLSGQVTLQGGNALKYVYGSPRASVDVDFLSCADRTSISEVAEKALEICKQWAPRIGSSGEDFRLKAKTSNATRNPMVFHLAQQQPPGTPDRRVKIEAFLIPGDLHQGYTADANRPARGQLINFVTPYLATATATEIMVDKTHALANRHAAKARDVFDLAWMEMNMRDQLQQPTEAMWTNHLAMYDDREATITGTVDAALKRLDELQESSAERASELEQFLPYPVSESMFSSWCETARTWIQTQALPAPGDSRDARQSDTHCPSG